MTPFDWELLLDGVPALTLRNPWPHLIGYYGKNIENRTWAPPLTLLRLLIHAGAGWDRLPDRLTPSGDYGNPHTSALVCLVDVVDVCAASRHTERVVCRCGPWAAAGQFHWRLGTVVRLPTPVPCKGRLGLWKPAAVLVSAVAAQLALAA